MADLGSQGKADLAGLQAGLNCPNALTDLEFVYFWLLYNVVVFIVFRHE